MSNYLKDAWELHISAGEKVKLTPAPGEKITSILGALRTYKARSTKAYREFGMTELAEMLEGTALKHLITGTGIVVWLEEKGRNNSGLFEVIADEDLA